MPSHSASAAPPPGKLSIPVQTVRNARSRRYILRLLPSGIARVTIPRGGTQKFALEFAAKHREWIEQQLLRSRTELNPGDTIYFRGEQIPVSIDESDPKFLRAGDVLVPNLPGRSVRANIEARLRALAVPELIGRTRELAAQLGFQLAGIQVRSQRSRWGSCSTRGKISLNWRLIQTPDFVRDYIIVHELMHLREMNHSDRYWAHVAAAFPRYDEAERWLRRHGRLLR